MKDKADTLVMLSGGLDSTTLLYKLLKETDYKIHVHYVHYLDSEERAYCENMAVCSIINWCHENIRSFVFSRNIFDFRFMSRAPWDYQILSFMAGQICTTWPDIKRVAFGLEANEIDYTLWGLNWTHGRNIFDVCHRVTEDRPQWIFPIKDMSRKDEFDFIPRSLYNLTWSCRTPILKDNLYKPCLECSPCKEAKKQGFPIQPDLVVSVAGFSSGSQE